MNRYQRKYQVPDVTSLRLLVVDAAPSLTRGRCCVQLTQEGKTRSWHAHSWAASVTTPPPSALCVDRRQHRVKTVTNGHQKISTSSVNNYRKHHLHHAGLACLKGQPYNSCRCQSICRNISETKQDRLTVTMQHYAEVGTTDAVATFSPPLCGDTNDEKHVQILIRPPVSRWRQITAVVNIP